MTEPTTAPTGLTFEARNNQLNVATVHWVKVPDTYICSECRARGGWLPEVWQEDCPACGGTDPYGQDRYCGECEYCCGC